MWDTKLRSSVSRHVYHNQNFLLNLDLYTQSNHLHQHPMHHHVQYPHENPSLSPQQSSTSDADETSTPPPPLNRGVVCFEIKKYERFLFN
jgi:hypothetical protein